MEHPLDDHYVAMYRSYVDRPRDAPPTPRLGYEGPTPRGPVPEENGRLVDSSPERSRFTGRGPKDASATVGGARRVSSGTRRARREDSSARPRRRSPEPAPATRRRRSRRTAAPERERAGRASERPQGTPGLGAPTSGSESDEHGEHRGSATKGEAPRTGRPFALPSEARRGGGPRPVGPHVVVVEEEEEEPSGGGGAQHADESTRRRRARGGDTRRPRARSARRLRRRRGGDAHASARAADDRGTASSEARRSAPKAPADDPDAVLDRLDEVLASDVRDGKWTDRLLGVLELHSVFSEHDSQVRQATEKLKRNDRAVADAERRADKLREKLKHMRDEVDSRSENVARTLRGD